MYRFWASVIEPLLTSLAPRVLVEIGSDQAKNTRHLAEFSRRTGAVLHAIDPEPGFDVSAYAARYGPHFVFHRGTSLDSLPRVGAMQAVLIDGDHNWHTVYGELTRLDTLAREQGQPFPLVLLHDVDWPYGRRDLYYAPDRIPESSRKPYRRAGVVMSSPALQNAGGLNCHMNHAASEGGPRNGVLTAIEDFRQSTAQSLSFIQVPGFHGLGILLPHRLMDENTALAQVVTRLEARFAEAAAIESMEARRLVLEIAAQKFGRARDQYGPGQALAPGKIAASLARWTTRGAERLIERLIAAEQRADFGQPSSPAQRLHQHAAEIIAYPWDRAQAVGTRAQS